MATHQRSVTTSPAESGGSRASGPGGVVFAALPFAACFAYLPAGSGELCEQGRRLCAGLKAADRHRLPSLIARVWLETVNHGNFSATLGVRTVLVPTPGSTPSGRSWSVAARVAWCLKELGLAAEVWPVLRRCHAVRKSACAPAGERPSVLEHYASFRIQDAFVGAGPDTGGGVRDPRGQPLRLTLVDDVITRGRTLLAAAGRLREAFPSAEVRAFAVLRTLGRDEPLWRLVDPCEGEVRWIAGDARRLP